MNKLTAFLNMLQTVDAYFPIGTFTLSNGLETYVQQEKIKNCEHLQVFIDSYMKALPYNDLGLMYHAFLKAEDEEAVITLDMLCSAMKSAFEIREGSRKTCMRFLKAEEKMTSGDGSKNMQLKNYFRLIQAGRADGYHPIALGIYAYEQKADIETALGMYSYSVLSAIVNNTVKLVPLSQMDGQRILYENIMEIPETVSRTMGVELNMLGVSGCSYDIRCMQHERLYSRLYMS